MRAPTRQSESGYVLILVLSLTAMMLILLVGLTKSVVNENYFSTNSRDSEQAFHIAEAGINYYTWFLNHNPGDFEDGQGIAGPYSHEFHDALGNPVGSFTLDLDAPVAGSTIGTVRSTGRVTGSKATPRTVEAQIGIPSLARYAFLTDTDVWFGDGESVDGELHANGGIRFDGDGNDRITSAKATYTCQSYHGCSGSGQTKPGIWGTGGPSSLWSFPVPDIDFDQISGDLSDLKALAQSADGLYLSQTTGQYYGYHLVFSSNNTATAADDTVRVYRVRQTYQDSGYTSDEGWQNYRDRIQQQQNYATYDMPANGVIFVDDNIWVSGQTSSRVTVAAASLSGNANHYRSIVVDDDLTYYAQNGTAVIGLIAEKDIRVPSDSPSDLVIHGVLLAQNGKVIRPYYTSNTRTRITTYGGIITKLVWTWSWVSGSTITSGYVNTDSTYDPYLLYQPPPYFPSTGDYEVLHWEEVRD